MPTLAARRRLGAAKAGPPVPNPLFWFDATKLTGLADGAAVANWPDLSGNGNTVAQSNATYQPAYHAASTGTIKAGTPDVEFGPGGGTTKSALISASNIALLPLSVFVVARGSALGTSCLVSGSNAVAGSGSITGFWIKTSAGSRAIAIDPGASILTQANNATPSFVLGFSIDAGGNYKFYVDSTSVDPWFGQHTVSYGTAEVVLGMLGTNLTATTDLPWQGRIGEVLGYSSALSLSDADKVISYLQTKWGVT